MAAQISDKRSELSIAKRRPKSDFDTVSTLCRFTAHGCFIPSSSVRTTSDGTPRMAEVIGATVTDDKYGMALSRVRTTTGLCLSGEGKR